MTQQIDIATQPVDFAQLLSLVEQGIEVVITKNGEAVAKFLPICKKRLLGLNRGLATISSDFDEPLPDEFWEGKQ